MDEAPQPFVQRSRWSMRRGIVSKEDIFFVSALVVLMVALGIPELVQGDWAGAIMTAGSITLLTVGALAFVQWRRNRRE